MDIEKRTIELGNVVSGVQSSHEREMSSILREEPFLLVLHCSPCQPLLIHISRWVLFTTYPHPSLGASRLWAAALRRSVVATWF